MPWSQRIVQWFVADRLTEMAERVAGRSRMAVWQRIVDSTAALALAESRGYIRARAAGVIQAEMERLIEQEGPKVARQWEQIVAVATESLVETLAAQLQQRRATLRHRQAA